MRSRTGKAILTMYNPSYIYYLVPLTLGNAYLGHSQTSNMAAEETVSNVILISK
jgi:hypothetical protein